MADYASQGKTQPKNPVDLTYSRTHQGYYTVLSRSASAVGTLILSSFHPAKITRGVSGALSQKFRELELLDNIMALRFDDKLPRKIAMADCRNSLIALFWDHKGLNYIPSGMHKGIRWSNTDPFLEWEDLNVVEWTIIDRKRVKWTVEAEKPAKEPVPVSNRDNRTPIHQQAALLQSPNSPPRKRKRSDTFCGPIERLVSVETCQRPVKINIPFETKWEQNSCTYDAVVTILFNLWQENPESIQCSWQEIKSAALDAWLDAFWTHESIPAIDSDSEEQSWYSLDQIREYLRLCMARLPNLHKFAFGEYMSIHSIFDYLFTSVDDVTTSSRFCPNGHDIDAQESWGTSCNIMLLRGECNLQDYLDDFTSPSSTTCPICNQNLVRRFNFICHPPMIAIDLGGNAFTQETLELTSSNICQRYDLRGVIYYAADHFTVQVIMGSGMVWYHDGLLTGHSLVYESMAPNLLPHENVIVGIYLRSPWTEVPIHK